MEQLQKQWVNAGFTAPNWAEMQPDRKLRVPFHPLNRS